MNLRHIGLALSFSLLSDCFYAFPSYSAGSGEQRKQTSLAHKASDAHVYLFLKGKQQRASDASPAAALTIHNLLDESGKDKTADQAVSSARPETAQTTEGGVRQNSEVAGLATSSLSPSSETIQDAQAIAAAGLSASQMSLSELSTPSQDKIASSNITAVPSLSAQHASDQPILSQLSPDQIVSQTESVTASPIPPVVTGTVDLEEFKSTNIIDLKVAQSRTFKLKNKIVRTSISDPGVAEPVVVSENQLVLLGKTPGTATLVLWDDAGNSVTIDLHVARDYSQLQTTLREIDPRIIVKSFSIGGTDRVILMGDVDHPDSVVRAFAAANVFMDDRGMTIQVANSRLINARVGEQGGQPPEGVGQRDNWLH